MDVEWGSCDDRSCSQILSTKTLSQYYKAFYCSNQCQGVASSATVINLAWKSGQGSNYMMETGWQWYNAPAYLKVVHMAIENV